MSNQSILQDFQKQLAESIPANVFVKISLGNYQGNDKELKNVYVRRIKIKKVEMLSFTYRNKTRDIVKNFSIEDGLTRIGHFISNDFKICTFFSTEKEVIVEHDKKGVITVRERFIKTQVPVLLSHDKEKKRLIQPAGKNYLQELNITDATGAVYKNAQDKYKQINQYVALLDPLIRTLPAGKFKKVVDMGSGKGYLTFALYDYLVNVLKIEASVTGVEYRQDLVDLCNKIASRSDFEGLDFVQGTIEDYASEEINLLIALHACDTATDDAIYKGIKGNAELIVVAPCCHKQIRRQIEKGKAVNELDFLTKYGIFLERQAEMVTDGIRALILEYFGYKTKVFEFISDAHTPKNVLVVGVKTKEQPVAKEEILEKIKRTKEYFGIEYHHLETLVKF
ncbi:SAM-dependent methyltransferase [Pedobacter cryoconitis]|uniref:SAM-dependent methyltransferase n=1 Tax=Pedobacter cryoconitis TaxID=188932 RepID=A0A7W8ZLL3_9SPHI|nr:SAM-dependent methyltransferase [Pedobacter cryoconitis]MBB5636043.1 SAM-dependent methyltransferase [Pedobacter cryoconitis]